MRRLAPIFRLLCAVLGAGLGTGSAVADPTVLWSVPSWPVAPYEVAANDSGRYFGVAKNAQLFWLDESGQQRIHPLPFSGAVTTISNDGSLVALTRWSS